MEIFVCVYIENFRTSDESIGENFESRSTFAKVIIKHQVASVFVTQCTIIMR